MQMMALSRFANQRDANEKDIVEGLQRIGASVERMDTPADLLVGWRGTTTLIEVKAPAGPRGGTSHADLTPDQVKFRNRWRGSYFVVRSLDEALAAISSLPLPTETDDAA